MANMKGVLDKCSVCGRKRFGEFKEPLWRSDIIIQNFLHPRTEIKETICPKCRELPFNSILVKLIEKRIVHTPKDMLKMVKKARKNDIVILDEAQQFYERRKCWKCKAKIPKDSMTGLCIKCMEKETFKK